MGAAAKRPRYLTSSQVELLKLSLTALARDMSTLDVLAVTDHLHELIRERRADVQQAKSFNANAFLFKDGASQ